MVKIINDPLLSYLTLDKISKVFTKNNRSVWALFELNCEIPENSITGLIGLNGAGKTTLLRILANIYKYSSGKLSLFGQKPEFFIKNHPHSIGFLSYDTQVYHKLTINEYLTFFAKINNIEKCFINDRIKSYAIRMNFEEELDTLLENVSTGTKQKVAFTSVIMHHPILILLDEPFSNIDILIVEEMLDILRELKNMGSTIILSSHNMYEIESISDNILLLNQGRLLTFESIAMLKELYETESLKFIILNLLEQSKNAESSYLASDN